MEPARWFFKKREEEPTTEVAIRRGLAEDLYVVLAGYDAAAQTATYTVTINPLVNWIWLGFGILALGTLIALLPDSAFAFATARVPAGAAGAATSVLVAALLLPALAHAQHVETADSVRVTVARTELEKELWRELICMCGTCGRKRIGDFCCSHAAKMRGEVARLLDAGKTRDEIYQYFIAQYGSQEPLGAPIDKGFNRLAWLFPYLVGTSGAVGVAFMAMRWSRRDKGDAVRGAPRPRIPRSARGWTMSSVTSTSADVRLKAEGQEVRPKTDEASTFRASHFFVLAALMAATAAVIMSRQSTPEHLVLVSLTIGAAGLAAAGFYRTLSPLVGDVVASASEPLSERERAVVEREKLLVLRALKDLEFDRAMGKVSASDFDEMAARLRSRALSLMKQLDEDGTGYRTIIERELHARMAARTMAPPRPESSSRPASPPAQPEESGLCACGTANDADALFCKRCGARLDASDSSTRQ